MTTQFNMQDLTNINQVAKSTGINFKTVGRLIQEAKVTPVLTAPYGKGTVSFYERKAIDAVILAFTKKESERISNKPPVAAAPVLSLGAVEKSLSIIDATLADMASTNTNLADAIARVEAQNKLIFNQLSKILSELGVKV